MARSRNIKPGFFKNENLAEHPPLNRLLYAGSWCIADRAGRLEDRPKRIRAEILPYDDCSVDDMLNELQKSGFILRYQVGEQRFIQIQNFSKHQNPHCKEPESTIPAPCLHGTSTVQAPDENRSGPADSLLLIPDSLNPHPEKSIYSPSVSVSVDVGFTTFWQQYPKKVAKPAAQKAWNKLKPNLPTVLQAIECAQATEQWRKDGGQFIPNPATWLNQRRWEDEGFESVISPGIATDSKPKIGDTRTRHGIEEVFTDGAGWVPA